MREGCGGAGEGGELQQRDLQHVEVFNTLADFDVGRLKESKGGAEIKYIYMYILLLWWIWDLNPRPKNPMVCRRRHLLGY